MALAFNQTGAIPKTSSFNPFGDTSSGLIGSINKATGLTPTPSPIPISQGTNPGLLHTPAPSTQPKTHTVITSPDGTTTTKQTFNVDTSKPSPNGNFSTGYLKPSTNTPTQNTQTTPTQTTVDNPIAPIQTASTSTPSLDTTSNANRVLNAGQQTQNENNLQQGVLQAGQTTPDERAFQDQYVKSVAGKQFGALAPYAESGMYAGKTPEELQGLITAPDLAGRSSADTGLYNTLGSAYGNAALAGLSAAQTSAARNLSANSAAYSGAQNQASRGANTAGTIFSSGLVSPTAQGQAAFSPLNGYQGDSSGQFGNPNDPATAANVQTYKDYYTKYNAGLGGINAAAASEPSILNTLSQFGLNNQPVAAIANLNELISGQTSDPGQQQLATQVSNYIKQLGIDPATAVNIAHQQQGTMIDLLNNLKNIATTNNNALKTTADSLKTSTSSGNGNTYTSNSGNSYKLPY